MSAEDELVVIDDGSTDSTPEILASYGDRIRHVRQDNAGKSAALNRALALTDGRYVWICDDDDVLEPGAVDCLAAAAADDAPVVFGRYTRFQSSDRQIVDPDIGVGYWPDLSRGSVLRHLLEDHFVSQHGCLVARRCYDQVGPFNEALPRGQDTEMFLRLALRFPFTFVDRLIFRQRRHTGLRGPGAALHRADQTEAVWRAHEQKIYGALAERLSDRLFEGMFTAPHPELVRRAARLQRACVLARRDMWDEALADIGRALRLSGRALDPLEIAICERFLNAKLGLAGVYAPDVQRKLRACIHAGARGREIGIHMFRGVRWRLRHDPPAARLALLMLAVRTLGLRDAMVSLLGGRNIPNQGLITELVHPPLDAPPSPLGENSLQHPDSGG